MAVAWQYSGQARDVIPVSFSRSHEYSLEGSHDGSHEDSHKVSHDEEAHHLRRNWCRLYCCYSIDVLQHQMWHQWVK